MKKLLLILFVAGFFIACKKDKSPASKDTVLSKIIFDNVLVSEFIYSPQKQLTRYNEYNGKTGKFEYASVFEYDAEGRMIKEDQYSSTNKLSGQIIYTWLPTGQISFSQHKSLSGTDSGKFINRINYSYDGTGRISQRAWINLVTKAVETSNDLSYYNNSNNLRSSSVSYYYGTPELQWTTDYSDGNPIPASLVKYKGWPINFLLFDMVTGESHFTQYSGGSVSSESKDSFSDRKYDQAGFLQQQTISRKSIKPALPTEVIQVKYEYTQL